MYDGIYILQYPAYPYSDVMMLHRVAACQRIGEINDIPEGWSKAIELGRAVKDKDKTFWNLWHLWTKFGSAKVWLNQKDAQQCAKELCDDLKDSNGPQTIVMDRVFPTASDVYRFSVEAAAHEFTYFFTNDGIRLLDEGAMFKQLFVYQRDLLEIMHFLGKNCLKE